MNQNFNEQLCIVTVAVTSDSKGGYWGGAYFAGKSLEVVGKSRTKVGEPVRVLAPRSVFPEDSRIPKSGDVWVVKGDFKLNPSHPEWGYQLEAVDCRPLPPKKEMLSHFLSHHPAFRNIGIGAGKLSHIIDHYKHVANGGDHPWWERLAKSLDQGDIEYFVKYKLLTTESAFKLITAWRGVDTAEIEVLGYLQEKGLDPRLGSQVLRVWGDKAQHFLEQDPYYLLPFASWGMVDDVAQKSFGVAPDDQRRLVGAVLASLYQQLTDWKHTLTPRAELINLLNARLGKSTSLSSTAIDAALEKGVIIGGEEFGYQTVGAALLERRVCLWIEKTQRDKPDKRDKQVVAHPEVIDSYIEPVLIEREKVDRMAFTDEQRAAVRMAMTEPVSILSGGAGCGKTTVLKEILDAVERAGGSSYQMALSGRAATRMTFATGREAYTIASFVYKAKGGGIDLTRVPLLVIDEASMLDLPTMNRVIHCLRDNPVRILFVGDQHQLPPIQFGLVFHRLVDSLCVPKTELTVVKRSSEESGIPAVAAAIRRGQVPIIADYPGKIYPGVSFLPCAEGEMNSVISKAAADLGGVSEVQVLSLKKKGSGGTGQVNMMFQSLEDKRYKAGGRGERPTFYLDGHDGDISPGERFSKGDRVMYTVNAPELGLNNGSLGSVMDVLKTSLVCDFEGSQYVVEESDIRRIELAYSITVHKAQGSQFKRVIVPIVSSKNLLERSMIYTAATRGEEQVVFVGHYDAFKNAVLSRTSAELRRVGLLIRGHQYR